MGSPPPGYEKKFASFVRLCQQSEAGDVVIVATPHALGDTYDELIESLNRLADAELHLAIVPRSQRTRSVSRTDAIEPDHGQ